MSNGWVDVTDQGDDPVAAVEPVKLVAGRRRRIAWYGHVAALWFCLGVGAGVGVGWRLACSARTDPDSDPDFRTDPDARTDPRTDPDARTSTRTDPDAEPAARLDTTQSTTRTDPDPDTDAAESGSGRSARSGRLGMERNQRVPRSRLGVR